MRNKYSKKFESEMVSLATTHSLDELLQVARNNYHYAVTKDQLRKYLSKRKIRYKDYNVNCVKEMGKIKPLFSERIKSDGMVQIKISDDKWEYKQRLIYSQYYNVKLTDNDYIIFLDQDRTNFNIDNLMRVTRYESAIMVNKKMFSSLPEVTKTGVQVAKLIIKTKEAKNGNNKKRWNQV